MAYTLLDLLSVRNLALGLEAADAASAIRGLNALLIISGKTLPEYADDAAERERIFPTGLPTRPVPVAIPHADPGNVLESGVAIGLLKAPVQFGQMGTDGSVKLDVHMVFLLAVKEQEKQVDMIQQLMKVIQNQALLEAMPGAASTKELLELILRSLQP